MSKPSYKELEKLVKELERTEAKSKKAEEIIRKSEEKYRFLFTNMIDGFVLQEIILDENNKPIDYIFLEVNHIFEKITGFKKENVIGKRVTEIIPGVKKTYWIEKCGKVALSGKSMLFDEQYSPISKQWYSVNVFSPQRGQFITIFKNITERKEAVEALKESERNKSLLLNSMSEIVVYYCDKNLKIEWTNRAAAESVGMSYDELIGGHCYNIWHNRNEPCDGCPVVRSFETKKYQENEMATPDGRIWYVRCYPVFSEKGEIEGVVEVVQDITERNKAEGVVKQKVTELNSFINNIPDMAWLKDVDSNFIAVNKAFGDAVGMDTEYLINQSCEVCFGKETTKKFREDDLRVMKSKKQETIEEKIIDSQKNEVWLETIKSPILNESGNVVGTVGIARDITERRKTEQLLKQSEENYRELADSITDVFFAMDKDLRYTYWNKASVKLTGIAAKDAIGKSIFEIFPDTEDIRRVVSVYREVLRTLEPQNFVNEYQIRGKSYFFEISAYPSKNGLSVFVKDITEHKKAEEALKESEERYRTSFDNSRDAIKIFSKDRELLDVNKKLIQLSGYSKKELIYMKIEELFPEAVKSATKERIKKMLQGKELPVFETYLIKKKGKKIPVEIGVTVLKNCYGQKIVFQSNIRDITERKKAEDALRGSEEKYRKLVEINPSVIYQTDDKGIITFISSRINEIIGYKPDELIGKNISEIIYRDDLDTIKLVNEKRTGNRAVRRLELRLIGRKGIRYVETRYVVVNANGVYENGYRGDGKVESRGKAGKFIGTHGTITDITERKQLEEQLQIRQRMDSLGTLAGGIAHDFNNLLTVIMGYIYMLDSESDSLTESNKKHLKNAKVSCERAADLIRKFQTLSRGAILEKTSVDIYEIADEVFKILKETTNRLIRKKIDFKSGEFIVAINPSELNQVFLNLGTNAAQSIEEKGVKRGDYIRIKAKEYTITGGDRTGLSEGEYIHIFFKDSGKGMSDEVKRKAFDPLFTTKEKGTQKGQGLGLAMVYNIITRNHNGRISIESEEGKGTTFHIYIPKGKPLKKVKPKKVIGVIGGDETILIVEDEEMIRSFAKRILTNFGYKVLLANDGKEGLDVYTANKDSIDLVLLDLTMPEMSGEMLLKEMLNINPDVKVIISSGHSEEDTYKGILLAAKGRVLKPYKATDLAKTIRTVLDL